MRIAALDVSDARIGVAVCDELGLATHDVGVVQRVGGRRDFEAIERLIGSPAPACFVVGLPINMNDTEGPAAARVRAFGARLGAHFGVPVEFHDERLTTFAAEEALRDAGVPARNRKGLRDQIAARIILDSYLASRQR